MLQSQSITLEESVSSAEHGKSVGVEGMMDDAKYRQILEENQCRTVR